MELTLLIWTACLTVATSQQQQQDGPASVWYVRPQEDSPCPAGVPNERCNTFPQILQDASLAESIFSSNTILAFLSGNHVLDFPTEAFLVVRNLENLTLLGSPEVISRPGEISRPASRILCHSPFGLAFVNVTRLAFTNISLTGCGANITDELAVEAFSIQTHGIHYFGPEQKAALMLVSVHTFQMLQCTIENSLGYGLLAVNTLGTSTVARTVFYANNYYTISLDRCVRIPANPPDDITACSGGNALFVYEDLLECPQDVQDHSLSILNSVFVLGVNGYGRRLPDLYLARGAGLGISLAQSSYGVSVLLDTIASNSNSALIGANIYVAMYDTVDNSTVTLRGVISEQANSGLNNVIDIFEQSLSSSGGLHFDYNLPTDRRNPVTAPVCRRETRHREEVLVITNSQFHDNVALLGAGAFVELRTSSSPGHVARVRVEGCTFVGNVGTSGTSLYVSQQNSFYTRSSSEVTIRGVEMVSNSYFVPIRNLTELHTDYQLNTIQLIKVDNVSISDCGFVGNEGSGLTAFGSNVVLSGRVRFEDNSGIFGGAMDLQNSHVSFSPHTRVTFQRNYARFRGGAIYVQLRSDVIFPCFFQVSDLSFLPDPNITLYFRDNYAEQAGSVLYGGSVDSCIVSTQSGLFQNTSSQIFDYLFDIGPHSNDTSIVSSDASQVCVCRGNVPSCDSRQGKVILPPGATLRLDFVTVGQRGGISPSRVYAVTDPGTTLGQFQGVQNVGKACTTLNFTILSTSPASTLVIRTSDLAVSGNFVAEVENEACPPGFVFDSAGLCVCDPLPQFGGRVELRCDIDTGTVSRAEGSWVSASYGGPNGTYDGVLWLSNCPNDYCLSYPTHLDLLDPDAQCDHNRSGVLCGGCAPGLSVTLASSSRCVQCSDTYLGLLVGYLLAGFALVAVLFLLDLTVTQGNLGGLVFYANVLQANYPVFFPPDSTNVITVFVAWLNLDPGVETCLYDGMDNYARNWLGYIFPIYIWLIVGAIILVSRFSQRVSRVFGSRSVPVLATLLLLSYNKLLRIAVISLSSTAITNPDGSLHLVWSGDGNVDLWRGKHIALGVAAVTVIVFFVVPYTVFLLLVPLPFVQARSTHRCLSWINKLKPFTDAHQAPFRSTFRNWTGVLLVARIVLSVPVLVNVGERVVLLVVLLVMLLMIGVGWVARGGVHKKWPQDLLECSFFFNLGALSVVTSYLKVVGNSRQDIVILVSGSVALLQFLAILLYHCYRRLGPGFREFWKRKMSPRRERKEVKDAKERSTSHVTNPTPVVTTGIISIAELDSPFELREPLLED